MINFNIYYKKKIKFNFYNKNNNEKTKNIKNKK